jgi:uncharacterized protein YcbX
MRITSLYSYPVKGFHRIDHDEAVVEPWGLAGDRRWMLVDPGGVGLTQREANRLALLSATPHPAGVTLHGPDRLDLDVPFPADGPIRHVRVFSSTPAVPARLAPAAPADWLTEFLGRPARLVWLGDPAHARPVQNNARDDDRVSLADGYPLLITNTASLDALNDWLAEAGDEPVPMTRFRPNVVVSGAAPWAEDGWIGRRLRLGQVVARVASACDRCVVTTIDQETAVRGKQPLRVLGQRRRVLGAVLFGVNLIPDRGGVLRVGDEVLDLP